MSDENPFTPPEVKVSNPQPRQGQLLDEPKKLAAGQAMAWTSEGFSIFKQDVMTWVLMALVFFVVMILLSTIPIVSIISNILSPVLFAGFYVAAKDVSEGRRITLGHLFSGFQIQTKKLVMLGVLYTGATILIMVLAMSAMMLSGGPEIAALGNGQQMTEAQAMALMSRLGGPMILLLVLMIPLTMAYIFAPQLIVLHGVPAIVAMKRSYRASMKNMGPFFVFGMIIVFFGFLAALTFGIGFLVLIPVMTAALYAAYRDIFIDDGNGQQTLVG